MRHLMISTHLLLLFLDSGAKQKSYCKLPQAAFAFPQAPPVGTHGSSSFVVITGTPPPPPPIPRFLLRDDDPLTPTITLNPRTLFPLLLLLLLLLFFLLVVVVSKMILLLLTPVLPSSISPLYSPHQTDYQHSSSLHFLIFLRTPKFSSLPPPPSPFPLLSSSSSSPSPQLAKVATKKPKRKKTHTHTHTHTKEITRNLIFS